jgi:hypothetical protein
VHAACLGLNRPDAVGKIDEATRKKNALAVLYVRQQGRGLVYLSSWPGNPPPTVSSVALVCLHCGDKNVLALLRWLALLCNDTLIMLLSCAALCCVLRVSLPA